MIEIIYSYFFHILIYIYFAVILTFSEASIYSSILSLYVLTFFHWLGHVLCHEIPSNGVWKYLNLHPSMHHEKRFNISRTLEISLLFLYETICPILAICIIQFFINKKIVSFSIILYFSLFNSLNHCLNYSILGSEVHAKHHANEQVNFFPDYFDHLFGKNADSHYEDMNQQIPLLIMAALATHLLKLQFQWKD